MEKDTSRNYSILVRIQQSNATQHEITEGKDDSKEMEETRINSGERKSCHFMT